MIRRALGGWLVGLALVAATIGWWGLTLQRTVLDSSRSVRLVDTLMASEQVRDALVSASVGALDHSLPEEVRRQVPLEDIEAAGRAALASPAAQQAVHDAVAASHGYVVGDVAERPALDTATIDAALREQLVAIHPELAGLLPTIPALKFGLPDTGLAAARTVRSALDALTKWALVAAVGGALGGLIVSSDRPTLLRRLGWWALATGALWVVLRFALPALARTFVPTGAALVGALAEALAAGMAGPGVALAIGGAIALAVGLLWPRLASEGGFGGGRRARRARGNVDIRSTQRRSTGSAAPAPARSRAIPSPRRSPADHETPGHQAAARTGNGVRPFDRSVGAAEPAVPPATPGPLTGGLASGGSAERRGTIWQPLNPPSPPAAPDGSGSIQPGLLGRSPSNGPERFGGLSPAAGGPRDAAGNAGPTAPPAPLPRRVSPTRAVPDAEHAAPTDESAAEAPGARLLPNIPPARRPLNSGLDAAATVPMPAADGGQTSQPSWVEGVGYVFEVAPFQGARWVDGVGYVVTEADLQGRQPDH